MGVVDFIDFFAGTSRVEVSITILFVTVLFEVFLLLLGLKPENKIRTIVVISCSNLISSFVAEYLLR